MIGKWGLGDLNTAGSPLKQGFDYFYGYTDQVLAHNHYPEYLFQNGEKKYLLNKVNYLDSSGWHQGLGSVAIERKEFSDELFTAEALKFISENQSKNFFLYLPYIIPHANDEAEKDSLYEAPSQREYSRTDWTKDEKDYAASISYLDEYVGRILDHLRKLKLDEKTLVIFTSDNGPRVNQMRFESSGILRGFKRDLYEGGIRVPFIAWWPGHIMPGSETEHPSTFWDFLPTACELANVTKSYNTDGISYAPTLLGRPPQKRHDHIYFEFHEGEGSQAVIKDQWKAVVRGIKTQKPHPLELYNLEEDPSETKNIASQNPAIAKQMQDLIDQAHTPSPLFKLPSDEVRNR
jgi:arylsulfatase A-like enzyme